MASAPQEPHISITTSSVIQLTNNGERRSPTMNMVISIGTQSAIISNVTQARALLYSLREQMNVLWGKLAIDGLQDD